LDGDKLLDQLSMLISGCGYATYKGWIIHLMPRGMFWVYPSAGVSEQFEDKAIGSLSQSVEYINERTRGIA
jgi:hypothetical protein